MPFPQKNTVASRAIAAALSFALTAGQVPATAWAELLNSAEVQSSEVSTESAERSESSSTLDEQDASDLSNQESAKKNAANGDSSAFDGIDATSDSSAAAGSASSAQSGSSANVVPLAAAPQALASSVSLSSDAHVYIQSKAESANSFDEVIGEQEQGTKLYAHAYEDVEDEWTGDFYEERVNDDGSFKYQWYQSSEKTTDALAFTPIEGATTDTLTLDASLASKYIAVKITVGSTQIWAPSYGGTELNEKNLIHVKGNPSGGEDSGSSDSGSSDSGSSETDPSKDGSAGPDKPSTDPILPEGTAIDIHHVELTGARAGEPVEIGASLVAQAYSSSYTKAPEDSAIAWQWQYADSKTTSDSSFKNIDGATADSFTVPATLPDGTSLVGKYLRVKAISKNTTSSTVSKSYYGTSSKDPVGPVKRAGSYDISSATLSSSTSGVRPGSTLSVKAKYLYSGSYGSYERDLPGDAQLALTWWVADDADGTGARQLGSTDGVDGKLLNVGESLVGRYVWATAQALGTPASTTKELVRAANSFDLLRVDVSGADDTLLSGKSLDAKVVAKQIGRGYDSSQGVGDDVSDQVGTGITLRWEVADNKDAADDAWHTLDGETARSFEIPREAIGKYVRVVATSGEGTQQSQVSWTSDTAVVDADSLEGVVARLAEENWKPSLSYSPDGQNVNDLLLAKLAEMGISDATVKTSSVEFQSTTDAVQVGISTADADNGKITFYNADPSVVNGYQIDSYRRVRSISFEITRGAEHMFFSPSGSFQVPWDEEAAKGYLQQAADQIELGLSEGDTLDAIKNKLTLPYKAGKKNAAKWTEVSWESSSNLLSISGYGWDDYTAEVHPQSTATPVTLTAKVKGLENFGMPKDLSVSKSFELKLAPSAEAEAAREMLNKALENYSYANISDIDGNAIAADGTGIVSDFQLPRTRTLGVDGKYYPVRYSSSDSAITINGYRATVSRGLPGQQPKEVDITCTISSKDDPSITASKTLHFVVDPVADEAEIDAAVSFMDRAKAGFRDALTAGQDPEAIKADLQDFYGAYQGSDGSLVWARSLNDMAGHQGIIADQLSDYDPMGSWTQARRFRSSDTNIVLNELLRLAWSSRTGTMLETYRDQPQYNTRVQVSAVLTDERYRAMYEQYKDDSNVSDVIKGKLASLVNQEVIADFNVLGVTGKEKPAPEVTSTISFVGRDTFGKAEVWAPTQKVTLPEGSTAVDLTRKVLAESGLTYVASDSAYGFYLESISSPSTGKVYGYDQATGRYWQLFVNGQLSSVGADAVKLSNDMTICWAYTAYGEQLDENQVVSATVHVVGPDTQGKQSNWVSLSEVSVREGTTAAQLTKEILERNGMTCDDSVYAISTIGDATLPNGEKTLGSFQDKDGNWHWWKFYVNGELSNEFAAQYTLAQGDKIEWVFGTFSDELPDSGTIDNADITIDPTAPRPDYTAEWGGYKGSDSAGTSTAQTPVANSKLEWAEELIKKNMPTFMSEPIIVHGDIYVAANKELQIRDAKTGAIKKSAPLADCVESTCRLVYADGVVVVPLHGGRVQALTADSLTTVWLTSALPTQNDAVQQPISTPLVHNGYYYLGTTAPSFRGSSLGGNLLAINLATGAIRWQQSVSDKGYYWNGAASLDAGIVMIDDEGVVSLHDAADGTVKSSVNVGAASRSGVVTSGNDIFVVTLDGTIHKLALDEKGALKEFASKKFANYSTSTPTISDGKIYVGGGSEQIAGDGGLYVLNTADLSLVAAAERDEKGAKLSGDVKSAPLVATHDGKTYVYFTSNGKPGGIYMYELGKKDATLLYTPDSDKQNYAMSSVIAGPDGSLYYINDSGSLFKISGSATSDPDDSGKDNPGKDDQGGKDDSGKDDSGKDDQDSSDTGNKDQQDNNSGFDTEDKGSSDAGQQGSSSSSHAGVNHVTGRASMSTQRGVSSRTTRNKSNATSSGAEEQEVGGLLDGATSGELTAQGASNTNAGTKTSSPQAETGVQNKAEIARQALPVWPFVGMGAGVIALIAALVARRKHKEN